MYVQIAKFEEGSMVITQLSKGISQKIVAQTFGKDFRTIRRQWAKHSRNESLLHRKGVGSPKVEQNLKDSNSKIFGEKTQIHKKIGAETQQNG